LIAVPLSILAERSGNNWHFMLQVFGEKKQKNKTIEI
jgi:hypothetical protein